MLGRSIKCSDRYILYYLPHICGRADRLIGKRREREGGDFPSVGRPPVQERNAAPQTRPSDGWLV